MNKVGSAAKVKLNSFDDLFGTEQPQAGIEQVQEIALSELHEFKGHPFKVQAVGSTLNPIGADKEGGTLCRRKQHKKRLPLQSRHPN